MTRRSSPAPIDEACRDVGFFQIVGHGIDADVERAAWDVAHEFFALPLDDKLALAIPDGDAYGYGPFKIERLAASLGAATPPDLKETFSVGPFEPPPPGLDRSGGGVRLLAEPVAGAAAGDGARVPRRTTTRWRRSSRG